MNRSRSFTLFATCLSGLFAAVLLVLAFQVSPAASQVIPEDEAEANKAEQAESQAPARQRAELLGGGGGPLFVGLDDATLNTYRIDPETNVATPAFTGVEVWGSAYDPFNDRVLFNSGSALWEWPVGGAPSFIGTITGTGTTLSFVGLAFYDNALYGTRNIGGDTGEGIYRIDPGTAVATLVTTYTLGSAGLDLGGFAVDRDTGKFYATNDDATPLGAGLVEIDLNGNATLIAPYLDGETDVDGLAIGDGRAYLITDDNTPPYFHVFDFSVMTYTAVVSSPFTTSEIFAGGAWIEGFANIEVDPTSLSSTQATDTIVIQTLTISNTGDGTLDWEIFEEAPAAMPAPAPASLPVVPYEAGRHAPSAGAAPAEAARSQGSDDSAPLRLAGLPSTEAYAWNSQNGPYYTVFDLAVPEILPNTTIFTGTGSFIGAGEYYDGAVYMLDTANNLWEVDPATGAIQNTYTATAPPAGESYSGMALDPTDGTMYAVSTSVVSSTLLIIDPTSGAAGVIGTITNAPAVIAIAIDAYGDQYGYDIVTDELLHINKFTAAGTVIGSIGFDANFGQGMAYHPATDTIYMAAFNNATFQAELRSVNTVTGNSTFVGVLGSTTPGGLNQLPFLGLDMSDICSPADLPWASVMPASGMIPAGASSDLSVTIDSTGYPVGVYSGSLCIESNDPDRHFLRVPVTMTVVGPNIEVDPASLESDVPVGSLKVETLTISNTGQVALDWSIFEEVPASAPVGAPAAPFAAGPFAPSIGAAPAEGGRQQGAGASSPLRQGGLPSTEAYSWNSQNGPFYTVFDLAVPEVLPNTTIFTGTGNFIGAGEYYSGAVYMLDAANNMWEVDPATGAIQNSYTATAPPAGETYTGLALDPTDGSMYASSTSVSNSTLLQIDPVTGVAGVIGSITNGPGVIAIAIDADGDLYGYDIVTDELLRIDKGTGAGTVIGSIGFDANFGQGMAYHPATDTIYMAAFNSSTFQPELRSVDTGTGSTLLVGVLGSTTPGGLNQLSFLGLDLSDVCSPADVPWASVSPAGGITPAGSSTEVQVSLDASGYALGVYTGTLCIESNDPYKHFLRVPMTMTVVPAEIYLPIVRNDVGSAADQPAARMTAASAVPLAVLLIGGVLLIAPRRKGDRRQT